MTSKKIASTPERAPATRTTDIKQKALTEQDIILSHMLNGLAINADQALLEYGIKHLHSVIPKIEQFIKVNRTEINRPHPRTKKIRAIANYWIEDCLIAIYATPEAREELFRQQQSINIAKSRKHDNQTLLKMCCYCTRETMEAKLHEIYGQLAANDSQ